MKQKNILIVFWNLGLGGIQRRIVDISRLLEKKQYGHYRVMILLNYKTHFSLERFINRKTTDIFYTPYSTYGRINLLFFFFSIFYYSVRLRPIALLTFLDMTSILSILVKKLFFWYPLRVVCSEETFPSLHTTSPRLLSLMRRFYPQADHIIVQTKAVKEDLREHFHIPQDLMAVIPCWTPLPLPNIHIRTKPAYDLFYAGRFSKQKDLFFLLKAIALLIKKRPSLSVCLIGEGEDEGKVRAFIRNNNLVGHITMKKSVPNISTYLAGTKIFVLTSRFESMPLTLLEAMRAKKPSVVRRFTGVGECTLDGRTSYVVDTVEQYASKIVLLLKNSMKRRQMGEEAYRYVQKNFSTTKLDRFLKTVIGEIP